MNRAGLAEEFLPTAFVIDQLGPDLEEINRATAAAAALLPMDLPCSLSSISHSISNRFFQCFS